MFLCPFGWYCSACFGILFVSILCTCCSHFSWYCFISFTLFCAPVFPLIHWIFSLSSFVIPSNCLKNFVCDASKCHSCWRCLNKVLSYLIFSLVWCVCSSHITYLVLTVVTAYETSNGTAHFVMSYRLLQLTQSLNRRRLKQAVYILGSASCASHVLLILCPSPPMGTIYGSRAHCCALKSLMGSGQGACPQMWNSSLFPLHSLPS